jgi:hypothetical protein
MKWLIACTLAVVLAGPTMSFAQTDDLQPADPNQYRDVEDAQTLKGLAYLLTPLGMALEWGVARPLHYLATQTSMGPLLSGDKESVFFTENDNADQLPPGTFGPYKINPTNSLQVSNEAPTAVSPLSRTAPPTSIPPSKAVTSGTQPALH